MGKYDRKNRLDPSQTVKKSLQLNKRLYLNYTKIRSFYVVPLSHILKAGQKVQVSSYVPQHLAQIQPNPGEVSSETPGVLEPACCGTPPSPSSGGTPPSPTCSNKVPSNVQYLALLPGRIKDSTQQQPVHSTAKLPGRDERCRPGLGLCEMFVQNCMEPAWRRSLA